MNINEISSSDITEIDFVAHSFSEWKPRRMKTTQTLKEIQVKVHKMNETTSVIKTGAAVGAIGAGAIFIIAGIATVLMPSAAPVTIPVAVEAAGAAGVGAGLAGVALAGAGIFTVAAFTTVLVKLKFDKNKAKEISLIVEGDQKETETFFNRLNLKLNYWDTGGKNKSYENLSAVGVVINDIGQVFGEFITMVKQSKPKGELSQYLMQKQSDLQKDFELLSNICTYLILYELYLSVKPIGSDKKSFKHIPHRGTTVSILYYI